MTLDALYNILSNAPVFNGTSLNLPANALGPDGPVDKLISSWMGSTMTVSGMTQPPQKDSNSITLTGKMSLLNVNDQSVTTIVFSIIDGNGNPVADGTPALYIDIPLPASWKFATSFPILGSDSFSQLDFRQCHFLLCSYAKAATAPYPSLSPGLNFYSGALQTTSGLLNTVASLLGGGTSITISGGIQILGGNIADLDKLQPGILITTPTVSIDLHFLTLPVYLQCSTAIAGTNNKLSAAILLCSKVTIGQAPPIPVSVDISNPGKQLVFEAKLGNAVTHGLEELAKFMNNAPVGEVLKQYIKNLSNLITLKAVRLYFDTSLLTKSPLQAFSAIAADVGSTSEWDILPGYFDIKTFDVTFMVDDITNSPSISTLVNGTAILVDNVPVLVNANFPQPAFYVQLYNSTLNLTQLFSKFYPAASGFPVLICNQLYVNGTPGNKNYSLQAGFTGEWKINSGIRSIQLKESSLSLNYDGNKNPATTGNIYAVVDFLPATGTDPIAEFMVNWDIRTSFQLTGKFPEINLTQLAKDIVGVVNLSLPSGFPQLDLKDTTVTLTVTNSNGGNQPTGTNYDFNITSTVQINGTDVGLLFEIQKKDGVWGCLAGVWTQNWSWSPAQQWPGTFADIFKDISFTKSGLLISSLDNPAVQWTNPPSTIPKTVGKGLTFFTTIAFGGDLLKTLNMFFPNATGINLYAYIADPLSNSQFIASIGEPSKQNKYSFNGFQLIISPATKSFSLQTGVSFSFTEIAGPNKGKEVKLEFIGGGTLTLDGSFDLYFVFKANSELINQRNVQLMQMHTHRRLVRNMLTSIAPPTTSPGWKDPLGLEGLTIKNFWGEIGVSVKGELMFGFGGNVDIGKTNPVELELDLVGGIIGEVPVLNAFVFKLIEQDKGKTIFLTDLIKEFTTLDLSWIPVLNSIGFREFQLYVVLDPSGWRNPATGTQYQMGFYASGDILFYGFEAVFDIAVYFSTGIKASGYINKPLSLANGLFKLSDASGEKGPYGLIDTTFLTSPTPGKPYLTLSGSITLLGFTSTLYAYISDSQFTFEASTNLLNVFKTNMMCRLGNSNGAFNFYGSIGGSIDLSFHTSPLKIDGLTIIPAIDIDMHLDMSVTVIINPGFTFEVKGSFAWGSLTLSADLKLEIKSWSDLKQALIDYFIKYPAQLFRDLVADVKKWIEALKQGLFKVAEDVARILYNVFNVIADEAAKLLRYIGWGFMAIVEALVSIWGMAVAAAEKLVSDILAFCSINNAHEILSHPTVFTARPDIELLQTLTTAPRAQEMLYHYYMNQPLIDGVCARNAVVRARLYRVLQECTSPEATDMLVVEEIITALHVVAANGGPGAADDLEPLIAELRPYRRDTYAQFVQGVNREEMGVVYINN
jgi:hypothetical protein